MARQEVTLWRTWIDWIGTWHAPSDGLGGWSLSPHHAYVPNTKVLFRGDGRRESASAQDAVGPIINQVAGGIGPGPSGDGGPATDARFVRPKGVALGPDGSLYIGDENVGQIRRVGPDGIITTVGGSTGGDPHSGNLCLTPTDPCGDGGLATQAKFGGLFGLAVGPDQSLYIADLGTNRVRKIGSDGIITTIAGTGVRGVSGDGGPATQAQLDFPQGLAVGPDSAVYVSDSSNRIRRIGPDGIINTVAGGNPVCDPVTACGDGGPATLASLGLLRGIAVGRDGSIYITEIGRTRVRRVTPDGIIRTIAGTGTSGFSGDGGPATQAQLNTPNAVAVGPDDSVYVLDLANNRIRWFRPGGPIHTLAGNGVFSSSGDGGPATRASLRDMEIGIAVGPDGGVYVAQAGSGAGIRRIAPIAERFINGELVVPAVDGSELFVFTPNGQHLRTLDALTGALRYQFGYDAIGQLATITEESRNVTTVERDAQGIPMDILGPYGQRTALNLDANGYLSQVTNPANEAGQLAYTPGGLLTSFMQPGGQTSTYGYDGIGRLVTATDPAGKTKTVTRTGTNKDHTVTLTSPLGRVTTFRTRRLSNGDIEVTTTDPAGAQSRLLIAQNGSESSTSPDGTIRNLTLDPDPRWGMRAPIPASLTTSTPGGLARTETVQRTVTLASPGAFLDVSALTDTFTLNGRAFTTTYNGATRTVTATSPTGRQRNVVFDTRGRVVQGQVGNLAPTSFTYDAQGRLATVTRGAGANSRITTLAYGLDGLPASITDPLGRTAAVANDAAGRVSQLTLPGGEVVGFSYDPNGNVATVTPPGQPSHSFAYTARDEVSSYTVPAVGTENRQTNVTYNADRKMTRRDRPNGQANTFRYDSAGRFDQVDLATGQRTYAYDPASRLLSLGTSQAVALAYGYDAGLTTSLTWSGTAPGSVTRTYDNDFRISALTVNGSNPIATQYDADSLPMQVGNLVLTRNAQTGLITGTTLGALSDTMVYDGFGIPATYAASHNGSVYSATYSRDPVDRMTSQSETIGGSTLVFSYTYGPDGQLTEVRHDGALTATYTYDANGNRLSFTGPGGTINASYDAQDRLIAYGAATYAYTPNGELLRKTAGNQITSYDYYGASSLTGVTLPAGTRVDYLLDGRGRRVGRKVNGTFVQGFLYQDRLQPIAELNGAGAVVNRFVYAGRNVPAYMIKGGVTYGVISDQLGSPRLVIDVATGQVVQRMDFDEFGRILLDTNPGFQPFGFAGGLYDGDTQLVRFGARDYDAETGRWTTKDPIGFAGGDPNLYGYVFGDPVNATDVSGLCDSLFACRFYDHQDRRYLNGEISEEEYKENRLGDGVKQGVAAMLVASTLVLGGEFLLTVPATSVATETTVLLATRVGPFWGLGRLLGFGRKAAKASTCTKETSFLEEFGVTAGEETELNAYIDSFSSEGSISSTGQNTTSKPVISRSPLRWGK